MSFGYGVGDFVAVVQLALKVYEKCQSARSELRDLGRDVGNAHLVLRNIHRFWESEKDRNHDLLVPQQEELKQLAEACAEALHDIEKIQEKHKDLDTSASWVKRATSRSKYAMADIFGDIGAVREKLQRNTGNLALLHTMLTTDALHEASYETSNSQKETLEYLKQQADIIQVFVKTYRDLQEGKGTAPAYSQVAKAKDAENQTGQTIEAAERDLLAEGIDKSTILKHRSLIKEWLEAVILPAEEDDEEAIVDGPLAAIAMPNARQNITTDLPEGSPEFANGGKPSQPTMPIRSASVSTHRSQPSSWTPHDEEMTSDYVADMIAKVLRSKYAPSAGIEAFSLPLQRAFQHLDWRQGGWLPRVVVEEQLFQAISKRKYNISRTRLAKAIKAEDEKGSKPDHRINELEFIKIVLLVREVLRSITDRRSIEDGLVAATAEIIRWQKQQSAKAISSLWSSETRFRKFDREVVRGAPFWKIEPLRVFTHALGGDIPPNEIPLARNTTYAVYLATKYCITLVDSAFHSLRPFLKNWAAEEEGEVVEVLNTTMEAAGIFHRFESSEGLGKYHWLDEFIDTASVIPLSHFADLQDCPLPQAISLVTSLWSILDGILGLSSDIRFFAYGSRSLLQWRESRVLDRTRTLTAQVSSILDEKKTTSFTDIEKWYRQHRSNLLEVRKSCETTTTILKKEQLEVTDNDQKYQIMIDYLSLKRVPKFLGFFRPSTLFKAFCDEKLVYRSELVKDVSPSFQDFTLEVLQSSIIKIEFFESSHKDSLGFIEFTVKENVDFARGARVNVTKALEKSTFKLEASLRVKPALAERRPAPFSIPFQDEHDKEETHRKLLELPLPVFIMSHSIPDDWEILRSQVLNQDGIYFLNLKNLETTAILWHDPNYVITEDNKPREGLDKILQPVQFHFPKAFYGGIETGL